MSNSKDIKKQIDQQEKEITPLRPGPLSAPITCPPEYEGMSLDDLAKLMPLNHFKFATDLARHNNKAKAYRDNIAKAGSLDKHASSSATHFIEHNPHLDAVVAEYRQEHAIKVRANVETNRENWINKTADIRDEAREAKQFGPAMRGQELVGRAGGILTQDHTSDNSKSVNEALAHIAGSNASLAKSLANQLGIKEPEIVEGEFDEEPNDSDEEEPCESDK